MIQPERHGRRRCYQIRGRDVFRSLSLYYPTQNILINVLHKSGVMAFRAKDYLKWDVIDDINEGVWHACICDFPIKYDAEVSDLLPEGFCNDPAPTKHCKINWTQDEYCRTKCILEDVYAFKTGEDLFFRDVVVAHEQEHINRLEEAVKDNPLDLSKLTVPLCDYRDHIAAKAALSEKVNDAVIFWTNRIDILTNDNERRPMCAAKKALAGHKLEFYQSVPEQQCQLPCKKGNYGLEESTLYCGDTPN